MQKLSVNTIVRSEESSGCNAFHDLLNCVALHPFHLNPQQGCDCRRNVEVRNVAELDALRNVRSRHDEDCLHLRIRIEIAMRTPRGGIGDKVSFRLIGEHIAGLGREHEVRRLVALFAGGYSKFFEYVRSVYSRDTFCASEGSSKFGK